MNEGHRGRLQREVTTMVLYVAVVLLAALAALPAHQLQDEKAVVAAIWGGAVGLAVAHWFAFHVSASLFAGGKVGRDDLVTGGLNASAALVVALIATIPLLFTTEQRAAAASVLTLAALITGVSYVGSRRAGLGRTKAIVRGVATMGVGIIVVVVKSTLTH